MCVVEGNVLLSGELSSSRRRRRWRDAGLNPPPDNIKVSVLLKRRLTANGEAISAVSSNDDHSKRPTTRRLRPEEEVRGCTHNSYTCVFTHTHRGGDITLLVVLTGREELLME